ncbi:hypothetical protein EDC90_10735 [Martelella mediterranea]|uniref:Uncharacterized protein n=1 Tax=Martelella mediterranea TaxID=293089 RepID=A0A4R3NF23_9HYPH|nr:hypothetical protein EDC90_10735 [Martelella mediterranea]
MLGRWSDRVDDIVRGYTKGPDIFCLTPVSQVFDLLGCDGAPHERRRPVGLAVLRTEIFFHFGLGNEFRKSFALEASTTVRRQLFGGWFAAQAERPVRAAEQKKMAINNENDQVS